MAYATQQDMTDRYGALALQRLTDRATPPAGAVDAVLLGARLDDASALIDGYLAGRYALPMPVVPAILKVHCCALAMYLLLGEAADKDSAAAADNRAAISYLTKVAEGSILLLPPNVATPPAGEGSVVFSPGAKDFAREATSALDGGCGGREFW